MNGYEEEHELVFATVGVNQKKTRRSLMAVSKVVALALWEMYMEQALGMKNRICSYLF